MKKLLFATLAALPISALAQPSLALLNEVDVGGIVVIPAGVAAGNGNAYVAGFANQRIAEVTDVVTSTPTATTFARLNDTDIDGVLPASLTAEAWNSGRGILTLDFQAPNKLLVAGDVGSSGEGGDGDGFTAILNTADGSLISQQADDINFGGAARINGSAFMLSGEQFALFTAGTNFFLVNGTQTGLAGAGFYSSGLAGTNFRDIEIAPIPAGQQTLFALYGDATGLGVFQWEFEGSPSRPAAAGGTDLGVLEPSTNNTIRGLEYYNDLSDSNDYLVIVDPQDNELVFFDLADTSTAALRYDASTDLGADFVQNATVYTQGGSQYLLVSVNDGDATPPSSRLAIYGLNGAVLETSVKDWKEMK